MASIKPRFEISDASLAATTDFLIDQAGEDLDELLNRMGRDMVDECVRICESELSTNDHKINQTHLANSFTYVVERGSGPGGTPWNVYLTIKPGVSAGKIWALNYGSSGGSNSYVILPRNVPRALEFSGPGTDYSYASGKGAYGSRVLRPYANRTSTSGPREGTFFLERARDTVMQRYGFV
jgi:hypothetical protein